MMEEWVRNILHSDTFSAAAIPAAFLLGVIGTITSCFNFAILALISSFSGTLSGTDKKIKVLSSGVIFFFGILISIFLIGVAAGSLGKIVIQNVGNYWKIVVGIFCLFFGLVSLKLIPIKLPQFNISKNAKNSGLLSALIFGLLVGGLSTAGSVCCNPLFPLVIGSTFLKGSTLWGMVILIAFAIGYALPLSLAMIGLSLGFNKISTVVNKINIVIQYLGGAVMIILGFYFLLTF